MEFSSLCIPQPNRVIPTSTRKPLTIWKEHNGLDTKLMPDEGRVGLFRLCIPQSNCVISTSAGKCDTIRTKRDRINRA